MTAGLRAHTVINMPFRPLIELFRPLKQTQEGNNTDIYVHFQNAKWISEFDDRMGLQKIVN